MELSCVQLLATLWTVACQVPLPWIFQARILEWVIVSISRGSSWPRDQTHIPCIAGGFFTYCSIGEVQGRRQVILKAFFFSLKSSPSNISFFFFDHLEDGKWMKELREESPTRNCHLWLQLGLTLDTSLRTLCSWSWLISQDHDFLTWLSSFSGAWRHGELPRAQALGGPTLLLGSVAGQWHH